MGDIVKRNMQARYFATSLIFALELVSWCHCSTPAPDLTQLQAERRLLHELLGNRSSYTPDLIPTTSGSPIQLTISFTPLSVGKLDEKVKTLQITGWLTLKWNDPLLKWSQQSYSNVTKLLIPSSRIWTPDVIPYNHAMKEFKPTDNYRVVLYHTGDVVYVPHYILLLYCYEADFDRFPYDKVTCVTKFGSWVYDTQHLNLTIDTIIKDDMRSGSSELTVDMDSLRFERREKLYPCCPESYTSVEMFIGLYRQSWHRHLFLTLPGVILGLLIPFIFLIPPCRTDRIVIIGLKILAAVFYISQHLENVIPVLSVKRPSSVNYYISLLAIDIFTFFWSVFMSNVWLHGTGKSSSPAPLRKLCIDFLGTILLLPKQRSGRQMYHVQKEGDAPQAINLDATTGTAGDLLPKNGYEIGPMPTNLQLICLALDRILFVFFLVLIIILIKFCF